MPNNPYAPEVEVPERVNACYGRDPEMWFPDDNHRLADEAKAICATCDFRASCLSKALREERGVALSYRYGIRGGLGPTERYELEVG